MKRDYTTEKINEVDNNIYTFSVASPTPYKRHDDNGKPYWEVLTISEDAINFERLIDQRCPFIFEHDTEKQLGVVEKAYIKDEKLYIDVRFSCTEFAQTILKDILSGCRRNVSIGYTIEDYMMQSTPNDTIPTMVVTKWTPYECTSCVCAADVYVGYQRNLTIKEETNMDDKEDIKDPKATEETPVDEAEKELDTESPKEEVVEETKECDEKLEEKACKKEVEETDKEGEKEEEVAEEKACAKKECEECDKDDTEEIRSLGDLVNQRALAEKFISEKKSLSEFKTTIKNLNTKNLEVKNNTMEKFNLLRAIRINSSKFNGDVNTIPEYKMIEENKRKFNISDADIVVTKEQLRGFPDGSEALNQTQYQPGMYTENLRPQNVIEKTGCNAVSVEGPSISFAVCTSGLNAGFIDLNGEIPSGDMTWTLKTMTPHKMGCYVEIDYKAILQDQPSVQAIVTNDITKGLDQAKDEAILVGDGTNNKPTGIFSTSGTNEYPISGAFSLSGVQNMEKGIRDSNDFSESLAWVMNSTNYYKYARTPISANEQNEFLIDRKDRKMIGYPVYICNKLSDNQVVLGNFNELLVAEFDPLRLKVVEDAKLSRKQAVEIQAFATFDCLVRRPKSFSVTTA